VQGIRTVIQSHLYYVGGDITIKKPLWADPRRAKKKNTMCLSGCSKWWILQHLWNSMDAESESIGTDRHHWGSSHCLQLSLQGACKFQQGMWHGYILIPISRLPVYRGAGFGTGFLLWF